MTAIRLMSKCDATAVTLIPGTELTRSSIRRRLGCAIAASTRSSCEESMSLYVTVRLRVVNGHDPGSR